jgi:hypothetical protein
MREGSARNGPAVHARVRARNNQKSRTACVPCMKIRCEGPTSGNGVCSCPGPEGRVRCYSPLGFAPSTMVACVSQYATLSSYLQDGAERVGAIAGVQRQQLVSKGACLPRVAPRALVLLSLKPTLTYRVHREVPTTHFVRSRATPLPPSSLPSAFLSMVIGCMGVSYGSSCEGGTTQVSTLHRPYHWHRKCMPLMTCLRLDRDNAPRGIGEDSLRVFAVALARHRGILLQQLFPAVEDDVQVLGCGHLNL